MDGRLAEGEELSFAVVVCDVNGLKYVNDTYGHKAGDAYIKEAGMLICEAYSHSPVYRIGGDEFAVLLTGRDFENREALLASLNERVEANIGQEGKVVVSAGMSLYRPGSDTRMHDVFERADERMYQRKQLLKSMGAKTR